MVAGDWSMNDNAVFIVPSMDCSKLLKGILEDIPVIIADAAQDIAESLAPNFEGWSAYRDHAVQMP